MKKIFLVLTVFTVIFLMVSCGDDDSSKKRNIIIGNGGDDDSNGSCKNVDGATWSSLSSKTMDWYDAKN